MNIIKNSKKLFKKILLVFILFCITIFYCYYQNNWIEIEHIDVTVKNLPPELVGFKIAHVSDLHIPKNTSILKSLLSMLHSENPDIIVLTGDIIDKTTVLENQHLKTFCNNISKIADTFAVSGNHECWNHQANALALWKSTLEQAQITVLNNTIEIYHKNNTKLAIIGLEDGLHLSNIKTGANDSLKNTPKILLAHRPELYGHYLSESTTIRPDIIFSGHAHGGQFRIPFTNIGLIAPNQGIFPKYTSGLYSSDNNSYMIVSRGIGNSIIPFRINNKPHLPIIQLQK